MPLGVECSFCWSIVFGGRAEKRRRSDSLRLGSQGLKQDRVLLRQPVEAEVLLNDDAAGSAEVGWSAVQALQRVALAGIVSRQ